MKDTYYYPNNYHDSRQRFNERAKSLSGDAILGQWPVLSKVDSDLFVDHVWLPATGKATKIFVMTSGIHGSECYAGAAIQQMFMAEIFPRIDRRNTAIFIVHAMNPYGFKHHRRCTEADVNLNRNFSVSGEMFKLKNEISFQLNEKFVPKVAVGSPRSFLLESLKFENGGAFFAGLSLDEVTKGVSPGQFERPEHLEYGGKALEPQSHFFLETLRQLIVDIPDVIGLDLHTGLGDRGKLHLLAGGGEERVNETLFNEVFDPQADSEFYVFTPPEAEGFYSTHGGIAAGFAELIVPTQRVCALTLEFGTLGHSLENQIEGLNSFFVEHQGHVYGYETPELKAQIELENFARSYPSEDLWKIAVIEAARGTFERIFARARCLIQTGDS